MIGDSSGRSVSVPRAFRSSAIGIVTPKRSRAPYHCRRATLVTRRLRSGELGDDPFEERLTGKDFVQTIERRDGVARFIIDLQSRLFHRLPQRLGLTNQRSPGLGQHQVSRLASEGCGCITTSPASSRDCRVWLTDARVIRS